MFLRKSSFVLMVALLWTSTLAAQKQLIARVRAQTVAVPDFTGKTLQQVRAEALVPGTATPLFLEIYPQGPAGGVVVSQSPAVHTPVTPGSTRLLLTLDNPKPSALQTFLQQVVSQQQKATRVPRLDGDSRDVASRLLEAARLRGTFTGDMGGVVLQQSPPAGNSAEPGSMVSVVFGFPQVIVPSLYGMTSEQAAQRLQEDSLQQGTIDGENAEGSTVTSQSPTAGTHVPPGTQVAVTMTPAQEPGEQTAPLVFVPNLVKMTSSEAAAALAGVGLRTGQIRGPSTGFVSDQAPTAGNKVEPGTSVDLTLLAATVVVPDVMEESEAVAEERLKVFGLRPNVSQSKDWDAKAPHVVVEQIPSAGTIADVGSTVDVVIGNVTPPPTWWQRVQHEIAAALPLVPWWIWLAIGVPLGGLCAVVIAKMRPNPIPPLPAPLAVCTLTVARVVARTSIVSNGGPTVRFTLGLRDRKSVAECRVEGEPAVTRKR